MGARILAHSHGVCIEKAILNPILGLVDRRPDKD